MTTNVIELGDIRINVIHKDIKHMHLSVHPPEGRITISAPYRMDLETIRLFSISKLGWIRKQQLRLRNQKREAIREYISGESHYYLGKRYLLKVLEQNSPPKVVLKQDRLELYVRKDSSARLKEAILQGWYRQQLQALVASYVPKLESKIGENVSEMRIKRMKTRWGTCNSRAKRIWLNSELAKKPIECIEYVLIHEMVHLLVKGHGSKFQAYMDSFLPKWKYVREELNRTALGHVEWSC